MECMILSAIVVSLTAAHLNKKWSSVNAHSKVSIIWDKVFKNGPIKICGRQPLKSFTWSILEYVFPFISLLLKGFLRK